MNQENADNILYNIGDKVLEDAINKSGSKASIVRYGINDSSFDGKNILIKNKKKTLMINIEELSLKGRHNLLNAMAAITVADLLKISGDKMFDPVWRLPFYKDYNEELSSEFTDLNNAPLSGMAGAITAALFLKKFTKSNTLIRKPSHCNIIVIILIMNIIFITVLIYFIISINRSRRLKTKFATNNGNLINNIQHVQIKILLNLRVGYLLIQQRDCFQCPVFCFQI